VVPSPRPPHFFSRGSVSSFSGPLNFFNCPASLDGLQCPRGSFIHAPYCRFHMRSILQLDVVPSSIPGAGRGLFSLVPRSKGDRLVEYLGEVISAHDVEKRYPKGVRRSLFHTAVITGVELNPQLTQRRAFRNGNGTFRTPSSPTLPLLNLLSTPSRLRRLLMWPIPSPQSSRTSRHLLFLWPRLLLSRLACFRTFTAGHILLLASFLLLTQTHHQVPHPGLPLFQAVR